MIIFGERINGMYRDVRTAIPERDKTVIQTLTREQLAGGADVMDLNVGPAKGDPVENFVWLAQTVHEVTDKPLSLDSAKADLLVKVVPRVRAALPNTKLVINSCTAAPDYMAKLVPLAAEHGTAIIGLTMDQEGVPGNAEKRVELGAQLIAIAMEGGLATDRLFIDPIILPVNVAPRTPGDCLNAISPIRAFSDPPPHLLLGLSNVSQRCSNRGLINRTYLAMAMSQGLDSAIMDPLDSELMDTAITAELLQEKMIYCDSFLDAARHSAKA
jgi:5-methyltetrahydrofolate corrinoid/iron sulfur protein methyltransferase